MKRRWVGALLAAFALLLAGCSRFVDQDQARAVPGNEVTLAPGHPVGQTFVAKHAGLSGVEVWLEAALGSKGEICLHLRSDAQAADDLATAVLPLSSSVPPGFYRFSFPPIRDSHGGYYYAFLEVEAEGEGAIRVGTGPGDVYLDGALYNDHRPSDAQMAFNLVYDPLWMLADLGKAALGGLGLLAMAGLLYVVPGWALLAWMWPGATVGRATARGAPTMGLGQGRLSWAERLGIAVGLSLALYPLLLLWTDLFGLRLGPLYAWLPLVGGLAALAWRYRVPRPRMGWGELQRWAHSTALCPDVALMIVLGLVFGVRLLAVRTLDAPMWGDSYHHTMIAQLLADHGGLFDSWRPYAELETFTYHFGFHTSVAVAHWLSGFDMVQAVKWVGQILNGLSVLALYPLAVRVSKSRWAGVGAVLVAGLLSPMPMFYVNWGRYTQLIGQVILPVAVLVTWSALEAPRRNRRLVVLAWIAAGGLALTHYRVLVFYASFVLAWMLLAIGRFPWRRILARVAWVGTGAGVLFLPWFVNTLLGETMDSLWQYLSTAPSQLSSFARQYNEIGDLARYLGPVGWLLLAIAVAVALWRRRRGALMMALWWFLLLILTNPEWVHLPGSGVIGNFTLFIAAYIPASVFIGDLTGWLVYRWRPRRYLGAALVLLMIGLGVAGARTRMGDVQAHQHAMVTRPDVRAVAWVRENTPEDAKFWINSFFAYGGSVIVGSDGGWWLPLLAERSNTVPPLNYDLEEEMWPGYQEWVNDLTGQLQEAGIDEPQTLASLKERGVTHVYVGQRQGRVNYGGPHVLDPETLLQSRHYRPVYHQDRVWVFELVW